MQTAAANRPAPRSSNPLAGPATGHLAHALLVAAVAIGCVLRLWQYLTDTSLWLDEIALARGILDLDLRSLLLQPLPYDQVAPKGFLLVQKLAVLALGRSDYILRLVPFLSSVVALVAFAVLAKRSMGAADAAIAATLFATAAPLVAFAGVVKQYSTDVAIAVLLWLIVDYLTARHVSSREAWRAGIVAAALVWFSQPAVLVLCAFGWALLVWWRTVPARESNRRWAVPIVALWGLSALGVTATGFASMSPSTQEYMQRFWVSGFPPIPISRVVDTLWPWDRIRTLFATGQGAQAGLAYPWSPVYPILTAFGAVALWRTNRRVALFLASPVLVALGAAVARLYPFSDRLILFLMPSFLMAMAAAIGVLFRMAVGRAAILGAAVIVCLVGPAVYPVASRPPSYRVEDMKGVLSRVRTLKQPGDLAYVYYAAAPVTTFYADSYGLSRADYRVGGCHRGDTRRYFEELDAFRGQPRVWVLITHALSLYREREDILAYLDAIGSRKQDIRVPSVVVGRTPPPAEGFLYDLADPPRSDVTAATFPVTGPASADPRLGCGAGPHTMIRPDY